VYDPDLGGTALRSADISIFVGAGPFVRDILITFPVKCPLCGREQLIELPVAEVADALLRDEDVYLSASCCGVVWTASEIECEQIREYLAAISRANNDGK
jgi:hypothetical protein